jgi:hypothetical protein
MRNWANNIRIKRKEYNRESNWFRLFENRRIRGKF